MLNRLKTEGPAGGVLAQELIDRFTSDMDTVMREIGVSDLRVPKKVRTLAGAFQATLRRYDNALAEGPRDLAAALADQLPEGSEAAAAPLATYLTTMVETLRRQPLEDLAQGAVHFPPLGQIRPEAANE
jgi:cytochrome b pre-mRNA-processing protein 3